jgi:hypothetical protein
MRLKEHGPAQSRLNGQHGGIESLQMARLQDAPAALGACDQVVSLGKVRRQRLFYEHVDPGIEQFDRDGVVMNRRHGHAGSVHAKVGSKQRIDAWENGNRIFFLYFGGTGWVRLNGSDKRNTCWSRFQLMKDTKMVAAEGAGSGNSDAKRVRRSDGQASLPSTAFRQRE